MATNNPEEQLDETTLHEVFRPTEQALKFILEAANTLAKKYDRHPIDFAVALGISPDGQSLSGDNYICYIGPEPAPTPEPGDTIGIGDHVQSVDDHGESEEIRVQVPRSF